MTAQLKRIGGKLRIHHAAPKKAKTSKTPKADKPASLGRVAQWKKLWGAIPKFINGPADVLKVEKASEKSRKLFARLTETEKQEVRAWERTQTEREYPAIKADNAKRAAKPKASKKPAAKRAAKKPSAKKAPKPKASKKPKRAAKPKASKKPKRAPAERGGEKFPRRFTPGGVLRSLQELGGRATVHDIRHQAERDQVTDSIEDLQRRELVRITPSKDGNPDHHILEI